MAVASQAPEELTTEAPLLLARSGLWPPVYAALWLNLTLLALLVQVPRAGVPGIFACIGWAAALGVIAWFVCTTRVLIHDLLISISGREKLLLCLLCGVAWIAPVFTQSFYVLVDGPLWAAAYLLTIAARPLPMRVCLGAALVGGFTAAWRITYEPVEVALLAGFGWSWLLALGAAHFAWLGEPHGLAPGWSARRVVLNATLPALAGFAAAGLAWWAWPMGGLHPDAWRRAGTRTALPRPSVALHPGTLDLAKLLQLGFLTLVLGALCVALLIYLRRWFLRHFRGATAGKVVAGQVSRLVYEEIEAAAPAPQLSGLRGQIVALWSHWAAVLEREGHGRKPEETAEQYALRLQGLPEGIGPTRELTRILEWAHYGREEPTAAQLAQMEQIVEQEVTRVRQRLAHVD